jgi:formylglycine-generating enzyme required for sulfatase activity
VARIFLCHATEDKAQVRAVYQQLKALGFAPWLDEVDILPGQDWDYEIEQALETADFVLVFLSTRSVEKVGYVQREFRRALYHAEEMPEGFIHTIPVKLDDCTVPRRFSRHQWANLYESGAFERIVRALQHGLQQRGQPLPEPLTSVRPETAPLPILEPSPRTGIAERPATTDIALEPSFSNSIGMEFVLILAGTFIMGSPDSDTEAQPNGKPAHRVTISQPFYLGKYPVTQRQWEAVMGKNPSRFKGNPNYPVEHVSWGDAQAFLHHLNEREGKRDYRLPTEAQWEYACRAGTETPRYHADVSAIAWYEGNSNYQTHPVGQKLPNAWGLHDMLGNVWEWCDDGVRTYTTDAVIDPGVPTHASGQHVIRGCSWNFPALFVRATARYWLSVGVHHDDLGFRCACSGRRR